MAYARFPLDRPLPLGWFDELRKLGWDASDSRESRNRRGLTLVCWVVGQDGPPDAVYWLKRVLPFMPNVFHTDTDGKTALHHACEFRPETVPMLLKALSPINATDNQYRTPLYFARDPATVRLLVAEGADLHARALNESPPLHELAAKANAATVAALIAAKAPLKTLVGNESVLHAATSNPDPAVLDVLLSAGVPVDHCRGLVKNRFTPLMGALESARFAAARRLLDAGAKPNAVFNGKTLLLRAIPTLNPEVLSWLIDAGVRLAPRDNLGHDPLLEAAQRNPGLVPALLAAGALDTASNPLETTEAALKLATAAAIDMGEFTLVPEQKPDAVTAVRALLQATHGACREAVIHVIGRQRRAAMVAPLKEVVASWAAHDTLSRELPEVPAASRRLRF